MSVSLRKAIDAKCKHCAYDELDAGNWRQQVEACQSTWCPLHAVRPVTGATRRANVDPVKAARGREQMARNKAMGVI